MRQLLLELLAIIGFMFTGFSLWIFFAPPIGREARELEERSKTDPTMRERDEYARHCLRMIWFLIAIALAARLLAGIVLWTWDWLFG